jgi:CotH kinase protein
LQIALLGVAAMLAGFFAVVAMPRSYARGEAPGALQGPPPGGRGPGGFGRGPGSQPELEVRDRFDANKDKVLDATERQAARAWLAGQGGGFGGPGGRRGRRGFGPGGGFAEGTPGVALKPADVKTYDKEPLYAPDVLRTLFLQFEEDDWEAELAAFHNTDVEVPATVAVDGRTYKDVGVHFRGMSSYMMVPAGLKRSLNLSFDFVHDKQDLLGFRTLNLLNANGDPTFVRGVLYSEIAQAFIASPRINYMRVVINGENWGVYLNAEQFNKDFTDDRFGSDKGARWKVPGSPNGRGGMEYLGDDPAAYKRLYEIKSKDDEKSWRALINLFRVLNETPPEQLEARLSPLLDIDGALKFLALDVALVNSDGYWTRASDYSIYEDEAGRFHVIPHDVNEALMDEGGRGFGPPGGFGGAGGFGRNAVELDPLVGLDDPRKPLRSRLLAVPALRDRYLGYVREIADRWMDWSRVGPIVAARQALIAADVANDTRKLYSTERFASEIDEGPESLKSFLATRRAFLLERTAPTAR